MKFLGASIFSTKKETTRKKLQINKTKQKSKYYTPYTGSCSTSSSYNPLNSAHPSRSWATIWLASTLYFAIRHRKLKSPALSLSPSWTSKHQDGHHQSRPSPQLPGSIQRRNSVSPQLAVARAPPPLSGHTSYLISFLKYYNYSIKCPGNVYFVP